MAVCILLAGIFVTKTESAKVDEATEDKEPENTINGTFDVEIEEENQESVLPETQYEDKDNLTFSELSGMEFMFSSGAGAWRTIVTIESDGSFTGHFFDSDAGGGEESYPKGIRNECYFSGQFSALTKTGAYEYTMECISLEINGTVGEEKIVDEVLVITSEPYGFYNADEFKLYLPGKNPNELPEGFLNWDQGFAADETLESYGLYNVSEEQGFVVWEMSEHN